MNPSGAQQSRQTSAARQQLARQIERALAARAGAQAQGNQLRVAERAGPQREKPFARSFRCGPVGDRHAAAFEFP